MRRTNPTFSSRSITRVVVLVGSSVRALISPAVIGRPEPRMMPKVCRSTTLRPTPRAIRSLVSTASAITERIAAAMRSVMSPLGSHTLGLDMRLFSHYSLRYGNIPSREITIVKSTRRLPDHRFYERGAHET